MIIVIKDFEGDYEDCREKIIEILNINKTSKELEDEHKEFLFNILTENGINVRKEQPYILIKPFSKKGINNKRFQEKLLKEHNFLNWLKNTYICKSVENYIEMFTE